MEKLEEKSEEKVPVSAIAAIGKKRELGKRGNLIWRISDDLKRLKALTTGHTVIMGRKTYESIGRALPNRTNIVITRNPDFKAPDCIVTTSVLNALEIARAHEDEEIFILGGAEIYTQVLPTTDRLYLTLVDATDPEADTFFPDYSEFTKVIDQETRYHNNLAYTWLTVERE
jgi:dihydrofolate reductase